MAPRSAASTEQRATEPSQPTLRKSKSVELDAKLFSTSVSSPLNLFGPVQAVQRPPKAKPAFSVKDLRSAIPEHCFKRSAVTSGWHLFKDLITVAAFGYAATFIQTAPSYAQIPLWIAYWLAQGIVMTGVWVIAHECGHQAFSDSKFINDTVGWFAHSALLVPYHSWRMSHAKHHKNTCSVEHDEVFAAYSTTTTSEMVEETPLAAAWGIFVMLAFGWPAYLTANLSGPEKYKGVSNSHFNPSSKLFDDNARQRNWWEVVSSDIGFFTAIGITGACIHVFGFQAVAAYYLLPYLVVNADLVLITYLQHTDSYIPHYREGEFEWLRGALSTVDRSFGWLIDSAFHHIADTHVAHHIFHEMPWYHAQEATQHIRAVLGDYYLRDNTPIPIALWNSWRDCKYVEDGEQYCYYKGYPAGSSKKRS